jgi:hypothetical protein
MRKLIYVTKVNIQTVDTQPNLFDSHTEGAPAWGRQRPEYR